MASIKRGVAVASTLMLIAVVISACKTPYSTPPAGTPTNASSLFETPMTPDITMSEVANFGTSTALASSAASGTPQAIATQTISVSTQDLSTTVTPTSLAVTNIAGTVTATLAVNGTLPTSAPVGTRPTEWTLRSGEFPYCIARRFDVDPEALLSLNGLTNGNVFYPGRTLRIPQSGRFPGTRALRNHPATYSVSSASETVFSIACLFGDVRPETIVTTNNLSGDDPDLTSGQQLSIP